jgi:hypothetical protein
VRLAILSVSTETHKRVSSTSTCHQEAHLIKHNVDVCLARLLSVVRLSRARSLRFLVLTGQQASHKARSSHSLDKESYLSLCILAVTFWRRRERGFGGPCVTMGANCSSSMCASCGM